MEYYKRLYIGESVRKNIVKIIDRLDKGKLQWNVYVIVTAEKEEDQLEFFHASYLLWRAVRTEHVVIAGIAGSYEEALLLIEEMAEDTLKETGGTDIRGFLKEQQTK